MQDADNLLRDSVEDLSPLTRPVKCFRSNIYSPQERVNAGRSHGHTDGVHCRESAGTAGFQT